jgi:hypothetical protein
VTRPRLGVCTCFVIVLWCDDRLTQGGVWSGHPFGSVNEIAFRRIEMVEVRGPYTRLSKVFDRMVYNHVCFCTLTLTPRFVVSFYYVICAFWFFFVVRRMCAVYF